MTYQDKIIESNNRIIAQLRAAREEFAADIDAIEEKDEQRRKLLVAMAINKHTANRQRACVNHLNERQQLRINSQK